MTELYWIGQFILTAVFYGFVMFLWPSVVFRKFLKGKSRTFWFAFCTAGMVLLLNMVVLVIGLIPHALHIWLTAVLFYGVFVVQVWRQAERARHSAGSALRRLTNGTMGRKSMGLFIGRGIGNGFRAFVKKTNVLFRGHRVEYGALAGLCAYAVLYFSWGAFDLHSYGASDMYVHHSWIYGLQNGQIFSNGIYPEGMHTFIYVLSSISGIRVYSLLLFLGGIQSAVLVTAMWLFLKETFHWKYSALSVVLLFLILEQNSLNDIYAMSRIQWTIPEEFALYTEFLCGVFLLRYLRSRGDEWENLLLFALSVAASFATHFYVTIMAVFLCAGIVFIKLGSFFRNGRWKKIILAVLIAVVVPLAPMAGAFAEGRPLQGSLTWALGVMKGTKSDSGTQKNSSKDKKEDTDSSSESEGNDARSASDEAAGSEETENGRAKARRLTVAEAQHPSMLQRALKMPETLYRSGFQVIYGAEKGELFEAAVLGVLIVSFLFKAIRVTIRWAVGRGRTDFMDGAFIVSFAALLFLLDYASHAVGLPQIIAGPRILTSLRLMALASCVEVPDMALAAGIMARQAHRAHKKTNRDRSGGYGRGREAAGLLVLIGIFGVVILSGEYHGYLYYVQSRYPEAADTTNRIIDEMPKDTYTIISTTDELYQVNRYGYHEELLTLVKTVEDYVGYSIPTKYLFIFIEKRPLQYASSHFFTGPSWLGTSGKYYQFFKKFHMTCSESPNTVSGKISDKQAEKKLKFSIGDSGAGEDLKGRTIMESKAMRWMKQFQTYYPYDSEVYFEDRNFICYKIRQDPQIPYRMGFFAKRK